MAPPDLDASDPAAYEGRVLIAAPTRRDGEVALALMTAARLPATVCAMAALPAEAARGAGAVLLTEAALLEPVLSQLTRALAVQPAWSDMPLVLLAGRSATGLEPALAALDNVTLLERPASTRSVISAVQAALRSRARQYQLRDRIENLRQAEASLTRAAAELGESNRRQTEFLAILAHELRNPLTAISSGLAVIQRVAHEPETVRGVLRRVERQTLQLVRLVDDQLDLSRIIQGKLRLQRSRVALSTVLRDAVEAIRPAMDAGDREFTIVTPEHPAWMHADGFRLTQVFSNLLHNATKFTERGGRISLVAAHEGQTAVVRVQDNGVGIPPQMQGRIFDMFAQVDQPDTRPQSGLGIGLTLVQRLIAMHGGTVEVQSDGPGCGSTFTVRLPVLADAEQAPAASSGPDAMRATTVGRRVLVVDDSDDGAELLRMLLTLKGHQVEVANDGFAAVEAAEAFRPEIVLMDIGMPRMDGFEAARRIRATEWGRAMKLIALTGWGQEQDRRRSAAAGFDAHLTKPVSPETLDALLAQG